MREIKVYEMEPIYTVGETNNLNNLSTKLEDDKKILSEIENDYSKDSAQFKKEYGDARINYKKNELLYNWLVIKKYQEDTLALSFRTFPDFQKEKMKKEGWMFPLQLINQRIACTYYNENDYEKVYISFFDNCFNSLFDFEIGEKNSRIDRYYHQAIFNYKNGYYYACAVSLFPIIESYHQYINSFDKDEFYKIKEKLSMVSEKVKDSVHIYAIKIDYYEKLVEQLNEIIMEYFKCSVKRKNEPKIINRNRLMHGLFTREVSKKDCLQLFCVISNMVVIKKIIFASDNIKYLSKEISELQKNESI